MATDPRFDGPGPDAHYAQALNEGRLMLQRCDECEADALTQHRCLERIAVRRNDTRLRNRLEPVRAIKTVQRLGRRTGGRLGILRERDGGRHERGDQQ